jgi:Fe-Mn family superoxide dismutase
MIMLIHLPILLPDLPYPKNALEPYISARTLEFHHGKHHQAYVDNANKLLPEMVLLKETMESVSEKTSADSSKVGIFNNVAQVWNHTFYWNCMKPNGGGQPTGNIAVRIKDTWGSFEKFAEEFKNAGMTQFGSGWAWLVLEQDSLKIVKTGNADNPLTHGQKPLLTVDVWEHAYYLDYQNRRAEYLNTFVDKLINWDFVNSCMG